MLVCRSVCLSVGPAHWFKLKCLDNHRMDYHGLWYRYSCPPEDELSSLWWSLRGIKCRIFLGNHVQTHTKVNPQDNKKCEVVSVSAETLSPACIFLVFSIFAVFRAFLGFNFCAVDVEPLANNSASLRLYENVAIRLHHFIVSLSWETRQLLLFVLWNITAMLKIWKLCFYFLIHCFVLSDASPSLHSVTS